MMHVSHETICQALYVQGHGELRRELARCLRSGRARRRPRGRDGRAGHITWDQGIEMARHARFTLAAGIPACFCGPRAPRQRGSNENTSGLLRQYLPEGTDLSVHPAGDLARIARSLNGRPRKTLGFMTPSEKLAELLAHTG